MLFTWGHTQAFGTVTDTSSLATGVVATPGPNIVLDEKSGAAVALHAVIVRAIPGSDRGFVLTWTTGACNLDQRVVLSQDQDGALSVIVDRGPVAPATCDLVGLGAQVTVSTREPVSVDRIRASITG